VNTAHKSRQHRQRLKLFLPANAHSPAMRLTARNYAGQQALSKGFFEKYWNEIQSTKGRE
jgi:hypothetical protein